ncbi:MAG: hypothetical protein D6734_11745 [Candidatus Schekmanbacteria bacterium]|nr:MAG: hypothetical protein D6734_11745 [Candidatus Schekmanbacteria bacterium]
MEKKNCWEIKKCGREEGGKNAASLGVCPAATDLSSDGLNGGKNGGRICWAITGTFCGGEVQGSFAQKKVTCMVCEVYKQVKAEEGCNFKLLKPGQTYKKAV